MTEWIYSGYTLLPEGTAKDKPKWVEKHLWKCGRCGFVMRGELMAPYEDCPKCAERMKANEQIVASRDEGLDR